MPDPELTQDERLRASAYHEAAHAVSVVFLGYKVIRATIIPEGDKKGRVDHTCPQNSEAFVVVSLAGAICLDVFGVPSDESGGAMQDTVDYMNALDQLIPDGTDEDREWLLNRLRLETAEVFQKPAVKTAVEVLVRELLERPTMDGKDVHAIIDPIFAIG